MSGVGNPSTVSPDTLALLVDSVTDEALFLTSAEGTILSWNPGAVALTGIPVDQALGQPCPAALDLAALARHWPNFRETALPKPRGGSIPLRAAARSLPTGGHAVRLLRGNRSADSVVFGAIHDALIQTDPQGVVTSWNDGATRLFGWTEPEMVGRPLIERVPPEARPEMTALLERLARGQEPSIEFEDYRKDGSRVWVDLSRRPLTSATGLMIGILWVSHDIHARKLAEQALIAREKFTREVLDATGTILAVLDSNGKILAVNDPWRDFAAHNVPAGHTGAPDDEVGHNYLQVCHQCTGQDRQKALEAATGIESVLRGERKFFALEYACHSPSGEKNWFVLNVLPMGSSGGVVLHINITAQKLSQLRAEEQAERLKLALAAARMGVWDLDLVQNRLHWSPEVYSILGITEFDGNPESWRRLVHPDDVEAQVRHFQHTLETRTTLRSEFRIIRPDGTVRWVTNLAEVHLDANGAPIGVIGTVQDITDKKNAECERLRQITEQRLVSEVLAALLTDLSPQRLTQVVFERVADYLDCDVYTHFEAQGNELHLIGTAGLDAAVVQAFSRIQIGEQICGQVALRNAPLYIPHVQTCDDPLAACIRQVGIRVYLGHPLRAGDQLIGTLAFASRRRDEFADHEREFITTIAQAVATTMTRLRDAREIQQRQDKFRAMIETSPIGFWEVDRTGRILEINDAYLRTSGFTREQILRMSVADVEAVESQTEIIKHIEATSQVGHLTFETLHRNRDGVPWPVEVTGTYLPATDTCFAFLRDITERKKAENALRASEQRYRTLVDHAPDAIVLHNTSGQFLDVNPQACTLFGYQAHELLDLTILDVDVSITAEHLAEAQSKLGGGESFSQDCILRRKDGSTFPVEVHANPLWVDGQQFTLSIVRDITERKTAEHALRASEQRYRTLVDHAPDAIFLHDASGHILDVNPQACASLGYQAHELIRLTVLDVDVSITAEQFAELQSKLRRGESFSRDCIHRRKDGSTFPVEVHANPLWIDKQLFTLCIVRDVSERKRAEQQLLDAQQLQRDILDNVLAYVALLDPTGKIVWLNRPPLEASQVTAPEVLGLSFWDAPPWTYDPAIQAQVRSATEATARGESRRFDVVARVAQDARRVLDQQISPLRDADGTVRYLIASDVDITDRKKAEIALRESEDRLRIALKAASALAFAWEIPTDRVIRFFSVEPALGPTGDRPVTLGSVRQQIHPDDLAYFDAQLATTLREGTQYYNRFRVIRPSSEVRWLEEWGQLERDAAGQPLRLTGVAIDITDRQRAEQALLVHNRVLEHIASGATLNSILEEVARLVEEQLPGSHCAILVHHDDARRLSLAAAPSLPPSVRTTLMDIPFNSHHCGCSAAADRGQMVMTADIASDPVWDGFRQQALQFGWHSCLAVPILASSNSSTNRCDRVLGVFTLLRSEPGDPHPLAQTIFSGTTLAPGVSQGSADALAGAAHLASVAIEQDRASRALRESEARFRSVLDNSPALIYLKDLEGRYQFVNRRTAETLGVPQTEWIGHTARQILPPDLADQFDRNDQQILRTLTPHQVEETALDRDGRQITILSIQFPLFRPDGSPYALCGISTDITARIQAESDRSRLWNLTPHLLGIASFDGYFKQMNPSWTRTLGWSEEEFLATPWLDFVHPDDREATIQAGNQLIQGQPVRDFVNRYRHKDGSYRWIHWNTVPFMASRSIYAFARDITEEKLLEEKFRQAQKMEAIGRLAGGVAHDFNNLLTVINGYSEILLAQFPSKDPRREMLDTIRHAGERAATLTAQLLAFSRKAIVELKIIDLNQVVEASTKMLGRLIGEDIYLKVHLAEPLPTIKMDPGQLDQILINLAVNARDAMPHGGTLTIATSDAHIAADQVRDEEPLPPGHYVQMTISDTGCGMNAEVRQRLFEPFFTTKGVGKGTGLGLATVYGIIKQAGGSITVESEPNQGSTFRILLPVATSDPSEETAALEPSSEPSGRETILLVEDESGVRSLTRQALQLQGYTVIESPSPASTLRVLESHPEPIDLLLTDVIMPEMSGLELARIVRTARPGIKVLFMSGYLDEALRQHGLEIGVDTLLLKPFSLQALACKVREVLDGPNPAQS